MSKEQQTCGSACGVRGAGRCQLGSLSVGFEERANILGRASGNVFSIDFGDGLLVRTFALLQPNIALAQGRNGS